MVKSRFPGKPSKYFNRRKVSGVNSVDADSIKVIRDSILSVTYFNYLFNRNDEDKNSFHGFSPHEESDNGEKDDKKHRAETSRKRKRHNVSPKKPTHSVIELPKNNITTQDNAALLPQLSTNAPSVEDLKENSISPASSDSNETDLKDDIPSNPTLSGKFVLPSRSVHSSRVIKPNKRFLHNESSVPSKKSKVMNLQESVETSCVSEVTDHVSIEPPIIKRRRGRPKNSEVNSKTSVKFVLRKPRLKIKSQPLPSVGGPFSSPSGNSLSLQGTKYQSSVKKVFCGVCGSLRTFKFLQHARKFGIFSCVPCRKFILRIIRTERKNILKPLSCSSGLGNCPIRQNTLASQSFSNDTLENPSNETDRCEACWLNLCLRSFHISPKLIKRLTAFLPQILQKSTVSFTTSIVDVEKSSPFGIPTEQFTPVPSNETTRVRKSKGVRETINMRRGTTNTALRLSSHRGRTVRDSDEVKRGRGRQQKLPVAGPRVKHVCRSASLVLGQPVATFHSSSTKAGENNEHQDEGTNPSEDALIKEQTCTEVTAVVPGGSESDRRVPEVEAEPLPEEPHHFDYPPVARMLQDLGRANCELLDGMENHETAKLNARVSIDFWESYDPEEVSQMGFPLIGSSPLRLRSVCFLCGSAGLEKLIHCGNCCEPYHTFCVSNKMSPNPAGDWWRLDWLCPKCTQCEACFRTGGSLLSCAKCQKSYHSSCISAVRINSCDNNWVCPDCLFCKSCNDSNVHFFVGNMPLCKNCFKLRQKGNFCPLCQCCYDENDYNSKMMECAECKCWIHAQCEGISNEKYQVLSYLPSSVEFICRVCCKDPPAHWSLAVEAELRAGYLNVIKILSKNKNACAMFKASPKKQRVCVCLDKRRNPIHLTNLLGSSESDSFSIDSPMETSPDRDYKSTDLGLLTPKLTKDDEESLKTVKSDFLNLVTDKEESNFSNKTLDNKTDDLSSGKNSQLLAIDYEKLDNPNDLCLSNTPSKNSISVKEKSEVNIQERSCTCQKSDAPVTPSLSLLTVKCKATCDEYRSVIDFHNDMEKVTNEIGNSELIDTYKRCLKQIFPWFDPNLNDSVSGPILTDIDVDESKKLIESPKLTNDTKHKKEKSFELRGLLNLEQAAYYIGMDYTDTRSCLLCKKVGEGQPMREGRLLYCGQNEWVHTNCAIWSSEVFEEIDGSLQNVYSAVSRARLIRCSYCNKKGASLGCCAKSCPSAFHFGCAFSAECIFLESKEVYCKVHYFLRGDKETHKEEDFFIKRSVYVELDHKKTKNVLKNDVKVYIGALEVNQIGEVVPDLSDNPDVVIPCEFWCSRLFWSCKEPWKIVRYSIRTKVTNFTDDFSYENETNYTVDHSLEFTPPPSPIESLSDRFSPDSEKDIKTMISHIIDTICSKEEDKSLSDQQNADFLPPELKDVIYDDLPKDFLDRITVNDIFTKMSFDDLLSESKGDKHDNTDVTLVIEPPNNKLNAKPTLSKGRNNQLLKAKIKECQVYLDREPVNKWKRQTILQVDGAMDLSESDQSNDSCDIEIKREETDEPVKCVRCRRTYRTNLSYKRHLSTCTSEYLSGSETDLSEEEKTQGAPEDSTIKTENGFVNNNCEAVVAVQDSQLHVFSLPIEGKSVHSNEQKVQFVQNTYENSVVCVNESNINGVRENTESLINVNYATLNEPVSSSYPGEQTLVATSVDTVVSDQMVGLQQPTIIVQQMGSENVIPYSSIQPQLPAYQESQQPNFQYLAANYTQEKSQYLTANTLGSTAYHIQPQLSTPLVQNVPTVVGTIVQSNGVEQLVLNNPTSSLDVYGQQQNSMYITNTPMIVGMETVVSNTVMQSSRFITGAPGMLASSYSATTTQVFQAAKPVIDIPQGYVVVNTNPPSLMENSTSCVPNIIQNGSVTNPTWNSYKINYQDTIKINKNASYEPMTLQVIPNSANINGIKSIEANVRKDNQSILVSSISPTVKPPSAAPVKSANSIQVPPSNNSNTIAKPSSFVKIFELPRSSPVVHKEKPQQAVAPVVIKKVPELKIEKPLPIKCEDVLEQQSCEKKEDEPPCQVSEINSSEISSSTEETKTEEETQSTPSMNKPDLKECTPLTSTSKKSNGVISKGIKRKELKDPPVKKINGLENVKKRKVVQEEPKITFEISTEDGFYYNTTNLEDAWNKVYETVQNARKSKNLPLLTQNPFSSPDTMLKKMMGLGNNSMKYLLEQLPGISSCSKYKPIYHKKPPTALEKELYRGGNVNPSGCARSEKFKHARKTYDMFSWLASRHRRPPKLLYPETDGLNGNSRRATSMSLPMAMRFRHLKETSKHSVGVFRSDIHGRGLFCLRDIDPGEMVIEYAGEVIRSALTDKRERYYTEKGIGCYMFRIDDRSVVDATMKGNAARFINHSCEPNCYSRVIDILGKKHIVIFALRKIRQGEELTYDYKFPLEEDKINCHCLSRKCRKYLN